MARKSPSTSGNGQGVKFLREHVGYQGDECLIWPMSRDTSGYGHVGYHGKARLAHRFICELAHGAAPTPSHHAAHSCGRGHEGCVNPRHLSWKTNAENQIDRREHGTSRQRGVPRFKLTEEAVAQIRAMKGQATHQTIAEQFGVSRDTIGKVLAGKTWPTGKRVTGGFDRNPWTAERRAEYGR